MIIVKDQIFIKLNRVESKPKEQAFQKSGFLDD